MNFFRKYVNYLKDNPEGYWFKRKLFGWGWTPATWQGWLVTLIYAALVIGFALTINEGSPPREVMSTFILPVVLLTIVFIRIAVRTGEKPKWEWGWPEEKDNDTNGVGEIGA